MRVLILSQYYQPEPLPKVSELAQGLLELGHKVAVVTGFPNYPSGVLYAGYRLGLARLEVIDGVPVVRAFEYPYHGKRVLGRLLNYGSFMVAAPLGAFRAPKADVIYVWSPPLTIGIAAWIIARLRGIPFVYDVQDIWPEAVVLSGMLKPGFHAKCLSVLERFVYRRADHILVVTEGARDNLVKKGVPLEKLSVMPHWVDGKLFRRQDPDDSQRLRFQYGWDGRFIVMFAGNLGLVQGLETVIRAAERLRSEPRVRFVFIGDGADKVRLQQLVRSLGLQDQVQFIERQPMERMPAFYAAVDALLVHLKWSELSNYVIPTKTLAYLASGKPILMAMQGAAAQLVQDAGAGRTVTPESPEELAVAVLEFAALPPAEREAMGGRGRDYLLRHLTKEIIIPRYAALLERLAVRP